MLNHDEPVFGGPRVGQLGLMTVLWHPRFNHVPQPEKLEIAGSLDVVSKITGVSDFLLFIQGSYETGWYLAQSKAWRARNPGALGMGPERPGYEFDNAAQGFMAQAAHLAAYAGDRVLGQLSPRYERLVELGYVGKAKTWRALNGKWAGPDYGDRIMARALEFWPYYERNS